VQFYLLEKLKLVIANEYEAIPYAMKCEIVVIKTTFYNKAMYNNKPRISKPCGLPGWGIKLIEIATP
jgi:hypothetical protein